MPKEKKVALGFIADVSLDHFKGLDEQDLNDQNYSQEYIDLIKDNLALKAEETGDDSWRLKTKEERDPEREADKKSKARELRKWKIRNGTALTDEEQAEEDKEEEDATVTKEVPAVVKEPSPTTPSTPAEPSSFGSLVPPSGE